MTYDVDYFIKKFEAIPEEKIIMFTQSDGNGNHCAYGWCAGDGWEFGGAYTQEGKSLLTLFQKLPVMRSLNGVIFYTHNLPSQLNNGNYAEYQQPTPKQRILAALYDIKKLQQPEVKIVTKYVRVADTLVNDSFLGLVEANN